MSSQKEIPSIFFNSDDSEKTESDKSTSSEEKGEKSAQKKDEEKGKTDNQNQEQNGSKTVTTTTTTKSSGGNMPKTGDLIVMASLASASLATLGATSIVSGKHKLDQQNKTAGEDGSEE